MGHALFIFGSAGTGKTTFCKSLTEYGKITGRQFNLVNLDPSQVNTDTEYLLDICDYITTTDIMEECDLGPNGSLMEAFRELSANIELLEIEEFANEFFVFDLPGQIELFMHSNTLPIILNHIKKYFKCGILYFIESQSIFDIGKFMGNLLCGYISMCRFDIGMNFVLSKVDMVEEESINNFLNKLEEDSNKNLLYSKIYEIVNLDFKLLDYSNERSIEDLIDFVDCNLQVYDDADIFMDRN